LIVDKLRALRKKYPKGTAENELAKLLGNTTYGDQVSRFFASSNMVTGANITAGVRSHMWCMEKALCLFQSITDGGIFDLNHVYHPPRARGKRSTIPTHIFPRLYQWSDRELERYRYGKFGPLGGVPFELSVEDDWPVLTRGGERYIGKDAFALIDRLALEHIREVFPTIPIVAEMVNHLKPNKDGVVEYFEDQGIFRFEVKRFAFRAAFHGSANYSMISAGRGSGDDPKFPAPCCVITKMRAYESSRPHAGFTLEDGHLIWTRAYSYNPAEIIDAWNRKIAPDSPGERFMAAIMANPRAVPLPDPFVKPRILKPAMRVQRWKQYSPSLARVGDNVFVTGQPHLFSPSQFSYHDYEQFRDWMMTNDRLKRQYGAGFEILYLDPETGVVDMQQMVEDVDRAITNRVTPLRALDSHRRKRERLDRLGPALLSKRHQAAIELMKQRIKTVQTDPDYDPRFDDNGAHDFEGYDDDDESYY